MRFLAVMPDGSRVKITSVWSWTSGFGYRASTSATTLNNGKHVQREHATGKGKDGQLEAAERVARKIGAIRLVKAPPNSWRVYVPSR